MSTHLVLGAVLLVMIVSVILSRYAPGMLLDALDHVVMHMPIRPFLAITPTRDPVVGSFVMSAAIVGGFGLILTLSRLTGFWVIWPAAVLLLFLAIGFGVAFASLLWPIVLTAGLIVLRYVIGPLEHVGGEPIPFPDDGARVSALNVMIGLTGLVSTYASVVASRAREANHKRSGRH
jgi:hypothetical protein